MSSEQHSRVVRFHRWIDPIFDETVGAQPGVVVEVQNYDGPPEAALKTLAGANVLHISSARDEVPVDWLIDDRLIAHCPRLLCASSSGAGYDTIDVDACTRAGIAVVNQAGGNAVSVAEHTMGLLLAVTHRIAQSDRWLRTRRGYAREDLMGREIRGMTMGIVGIGHIGTRVAALARGFGLRVLATDPLLPPAEIERRGAIPVPLHELIASSDVVTLHCPRLKSTLNMFSAAQYARMKRGSIFISTARGGIHDEDALYAALASGHLSGAGLDVWKIEPPPLDSPLLRHETVVATYHTAGVTHEGRRNIARNAAEQILRVLAGQRPAGLLNPQVWEAFVAKRSRVMAG